MQAGQRRVRDSERETAGFSAAPPPPPPPPSSARPPARTKRSRLFLLSLVLVPCAVLLPQISHLLPLPSLSVSERNWDTGEELSALGGSKIPAQSRRRPGRGTAVACLIEPKGSVQRFTQRVRVAMGNCWGAKISSDSPSRGAISPSGYLPLHPPLFFFGSLNLIYPIIINQSC